MCGRLWEKERKKKREKRKNERAARKEKAVTMAKRGMYGVESGEGQVQKRRWGKVMGGNNERKRNGCCKSGNLGDEGIVGGGKWRWRGENKKKGGGEGGIRDALGAEEAENEKRKEGKSRREKEAIFCLFSSKSSLQLQELNMPYSPSFFYFLIAWQKMEKGRRKKAEGKKKEKEKEGERKRKHGTLGDEGTMYGTR